MHAMKPQLSNFTLGFAAMMLLFAVGLGIYRMGYEAALKEQQRALPANWKTLEYRTQKPEEAPLSFTF